MCVRGVGGGVVGAGGGGGVEDFLNYFYATSTSTLNSDAAQNYKYVFGWRRVILHQRNITVKHK